MTSGFAAPVCRVAIVGAGPMARAHIQAFASLSGVTVVGIHSRTPARAATLAAEFGIPAVHADIGSLHRGTGADLVVVAVSIDSAAAVAMACFRHPWAVLLEKPPGCDLAEADAVAIAARAAGARVWVALNRRHYGSTRALLADLADDPGPRFIHVQDQQSFAEARAWGCPEHVVRNFMFANSIHLIDYLTLLGRGAITSIEPVEPWDPERPGVVIARVAFDSGDIGLYEAVWHAPGPWSCSVTTARRRWELRPLEAARVQNAGERSLSVIPPDIDDTAFKPGVRRQAMAVVEALATGSGNGLPDLGTALRTMRLVAGVYGLPGGASPDPEVER